MHPDNQLVRSKLQQENDRLHKLIDLKKQKVKETLGKNANVIQLLNLQLENLRLQFLKEQVKEPQQQQSRGRNRQTGCCCLTLQQDGFIKINSQSTSFTYYLTVKSTRDYFNKMKELEKRQDELGNFKLNCCHNIASLFARDVGNCLTQIDNIIAFSFFFGWLLYILGAILFLPFVCLYRLFQHCLSSCSRINSRTSRILQTYYQYKGKIQDIHPLPI